jgi:hypothetical protein
MHLIQLEGNRFHSEEPSPSGKDRKRGRIQEKENVPAVPAPSFEVEK